MSRRAELVIAALLGLLVVTDIGYTRTLGHYGVTGNGVGPVALTVCETFDQLGDWVATALEAFGKHPEILTALSTLAIAAYTVVLAKATQQLRTLAAQSAGALPRAERAYLFVEVRTVMHLRGSPSGIDTPIEVGIWNYGKTPAELVRIRCVAIKQFAVPKELPQLAEDRELPPGLAVATNTQFPIDDVKVILTDAELGEVERWDLKVYLVGRIDYRDMFGSDQSTGFCWDYLWHMKRGRFRITRDSPLNRRT